MSTPTLEPLKKLIAQAQNAAEVSGENGENGEIEATLSPLSPFSPGELDLEVAIYPKNSWFEDYMSYARAREESADSYLVGSIIPVFGSILGRRVAFSWGERFIYPNIFAMLAGKPGDRKSSAINLVDKIARAVLDPKQFLPDAMSAEALFDEYDEEKGGSPDKILIADDANPFLGLLQKTTYGERIGQRLLNLYDCKGLYESFRRNEENNKSSRRKIDETSTSMVLGATFNICQFYGHEIRSGLQRRFLYYVALKHGRLLVFPPISAHLEFLTIVEKLKKLLKIPRHEFKFDENAVEIWREFQQKNRRNMENEGFDNDSHISRLNGQPEHVIKLAMIFELAIWIKTQCPLPKTVSAEALKIAIEHSEHCLAAGKALESISNRAQIQGEADILLAKIAIDFGGFAKNGWIELSKTELTAKYAAHAGRKGALSADDLYLRFIPSLIRRGKAKQIPRAGKLPIYGFLLEDF